MKRTVKGELGIFLKGSINQLITDKEQAMILNFGANETVFLPLGVGYDLWNKRIFPSSI